MSDGTTGGILVFAEQRDGTIKRVVLEALGEARRLMEGSSVAAVLIGDQVSSGAKTLAEAGADTVYLADDPSFRFYSSDRYAAVVSDMALKLNATLILMGATAMGKDLGPKVAARLHAPFAQDCIGLAVEKEKGVIATRPIYGGKLIAKVRAQKPGGCFVATVRPNVFPIGPVQEGKTASIEPYTPSVPMAPAGPAVQVKEVVAASGSKVELTEASIIVSGGRGLREPANFRLVEELAEALGAAVGASRAAVDAGWKPHAYQVGLTGKTVSPLLYIACGISGAIQHQAGMSSSKYILAINKDPNAPIFKIANYGIVGDLFEILPRLTESIRKLSR